MTNNQKANDIQDFKKLMNPDNCKNIDCLIDKMIESEIITNQAMRNFLIVQFINRKMQTVDQLPFSHCVYLAARKFHLTEVWIRQVHKNNKQFSKINFLK